MTHYRCAVFSNDPSKFDALLAPYSEVNSDYYRFVAIDGKHQNYLAERYRDDIKNERLLKNVSFEEWVTARGYTYNNGVLGVNENPNAKWDWYTLNGGDWEFEFKPGEAYDENGNARKNQFSYKSSEYDEKKSTTRYKEMEKIANDRENEEYESANRFLEDYPTLNEYLEYMETEFPYAYITPDGEWHSAGDVGWFGTSDDTPESRRAYFKKWSEWINSPENPYVNFVDCHI